MRKEREEEETSMLLYPNWDLHGGRWRLPSDRGLSDNDGRFKNRFRGTKTTTETTARKTRLSLSVNSEFQWDFCDEQGVAKGAERKFLYSFSRINVKSTVLDF